MRTPCAWVSTGHHARAIVGGILIALCVAGCGGDSGASRSDGGSGDSATTTDARRGDASSGSDGAAPDGRVGPGGCGGALGAGSEGTRAAPVTFAIADAPFTGGADPDEGASHYRVTGLDVGSRYTVTLTGDVGVVFSLFQEGSSGFPACSVDDTSFRSGLSCKIVPQSGAIDIEVTPRFVHPDGQCFTLDVVLDSPAGAFEGAFDSLFTLRFGTPDLPHRGIVDHEKSYYRVTQLTPGRRYTVWLTGLEGEVNLTVGTEDPEGGVRNMGCPLGNTGEPGTEAESCTVEATSDSIALEIWHFGTVLSSQYVISVFEDVDSVGAPGGPIILDYAGAIEHTAQIGPATSTTEPGVSYYEIRGLTPGVAYLAGITDALGLRLSAFTDVGFTASLPCDNVDTRFHCAFDAPAASVFLSTTNSGDRSRWLTLHVAEAPVDEGDFSTPRALAYPADFSYAGSVAWTSEYLVVGLPPEPMSVTLLGTDGPVGFSAWRADSGVLDCSVGSAAFPRCTVTPSAAGEIRVRASGFGHFDLDVAPAPVLSSDHTRTVVQPIPNGDAAGFADPLTVSGSAVDSIEAVTVEIFVDHGRPGEMTALLVAPDGTEVELAGKGGGPYEGLVFDDYALEPLSGLRRDGALRRLPVTPLHVLEGLSANGLWTLRVIDDENPNIQNNDGTLLGWGLTFR